MPEQRVIKTFQIRQPAGKGSRDWVATFSDGTQKRYFAQATDFAQFMQELLMISDELLPLDYTILQGLPQPAKPKAPKPKRKPGRPKGSKNKPKVVEDAPGPMSPEDALEHAAANASD